MNPIMYKVQENSENLNHLADDIKNSKKMILIYY